MQPKLSLPLDPFWSDEDDYVHHLLSFATESELFRNLCGGVHILDFLTRQPDLYATVLPQEWQEWFAAVDVPLVLQLLMHEDLESLVSEKRDSWHGVSVPPPSLVSYALTVRRHCLLRIFSPILPESGSGTTNRQLTSGMKPKKIHEVQHFSNYVDRLADFVAEETGQPVSGLVDFGSGQNYLGRTLVGPPYLRDVIAIERKHHNVAGAKRRDIYAKLAKQKTIMRNKKLYKQQLMEGAASGGNPIAESNSDGLQDVMGRITIDDSDNRHTPGSITYIEHEIESGRIENIIYPREDTPDISSASSNTSDGDLTLDRSPSSAMQPTQRPNLMVISLHSCGNLSHHGLQTLTPTLNPCISAVALIGCCYNLCTERLGPTTYKHPILRPRHPRLDATGSTHDPHGFPMSKRLEQFRHPDGSTGVRLNITARMMALQAPSNWGRDDSEAFFTRHFYRALLQRILTDLDIVKQCADPETRREAGGSISGRDTEGTPLLVGPLRKSAFTSFSAYVQAALEKLGKDPKLGHLIRSRSSSCTEELLQSYEVRFAYARKRLAIVWSLMAFSAGVVESIIVVDRWQWLKEQEDWVGKCWVEPVFDYKQSPRNLVVVGVRKRKEDGKPDGNRPAASEGMEVAQDSRMV